MDSNPRSVIWGKLLGFSYIQSLFLFNEEDHCPIKDSLQNETRSGEYKVAVMWDEEVQRSKTQHEKKIKNKTQHVGDS